MYITGLNLFHLEQLSTSLVNSWEHGITESPQSEIPIVPSCRQNHKSQIQLTLDCNLIYLPTIDRNYKS
jgi:hypothetical protein